MLAFIKARWLNTDEKKRLATNIFSLGVLQGVNYILPLLTLPYLVRVLGPEYFGLLAFATATIAYFVLITDYGFNLSATRQISICRDDRTKVIEVFSSVMTIKIGLMLVSFTLLSLLIFSFEKFNQHWQVYYISFGMVVGQALFPVWLFQGMEHMKYITYLNIGAKLFFTVCIFIFVREQADYLLVPLLTALGFIVAGVLSLYLIKKEFSVGFAIQPWKNIKFQFIDGWHVFFSSISISLYTVSTIFILGLFGNNTVVGYFAAADKIVQAVKGLYVPVSQAVYPLISKKIHEDRQTGLVFIKKLTKIIGSSMFAISLLLFLLADQIVSLLLGTQYQQSILLLKVMAFLPFIIALSNIYGIQTMLNFGYKQAFSRILATAAAIGILLGFLLVPTYQENGSAATILIVELFVTTTMFFYLKRKIRE